MSRDDRDYEVGYGKPPQSGQFKPGQSGNPRGRPKGSKNLRTEFKEEMEEMIAIKSNGKPRKVTKQRAVIMKLNEKALKGDVNAANKLIELGIKIGAFSEIPTEVDDISSKDQEIIDAMLKREREFGGTQHA